MTSEAAKLILIFGRFAQEGTMPNTIHGSDASNRDTSDAPLWYGVLVEETVARASADLYKLPVDSKGRTVLDVLRETASGYRRGISNGIRMDPESALIWSPAHFTWMDTNYPACTPREGYPVEIQVLWIQLLRQLHRVNASVEGEDWGALANRAETSLKKYFWLEDRGYIADLLIAEPGLPASRAIVDNALRSNYALAIAFRIFTGDPARRAMEAMRQNLVVPGALRTLAPLPVSPPLENRSRDGWLLNNPQEPYWGHYEGDEDSRRKPAYHNGTAWTWTFPIFCEALAEAWDRNPAAIAAAKAYLGSMDALLTNGCLGQLPEIVDGDAPHLQRGCDAQAWGATEALRVWTRLNNM
jgi:predicted glycogen debranching enzyme